MLSAVVVTVIVAVRSVPYPWIQGGNHPSFDQNRGSREGVLPKSSVHRSHLLCVQKEVQQWIAKDLNKQKSIKLKDKTETHHIDLITQEAINYEKLLKQNQKLTT